MTYGDGMLIPIPLRRLALAAALVAFAGVRASAQTLIVRSAPPGSMIELTMNGGAPVTATADENGDATLTIPARAAEADVQIHVDACGNLVKVLVVERGLQPSAADAGCERTDFPSTFIMRGVTTFVVDMAPAPAVHVAQGPPPPSWVRRGPDLSTQPMLPWGTPRSGLAISAGAGFSTFSDAVTVACGNAASCDSHGVGGSVTLGAEYWVTRNIGAAIAYVKPADVTASGSGDTYSFDSRLASRMLTIAGKGGGPVGPARLYGIGGLVRHEATITSSNTINDRTVTVGDAMQVIKGGTQAFAQKTTGWSWLAGGGAELWLTRWVAFYGEVTRAKVKGTPIGGGEGGIDDTATLIYVGARLRLGLGR